MIGRLLRAIAHRAGHDLRLEYPALLETPGARLSLEPRWMIALLATIHRPVTFVQIGANDGVHDDPIRSPVRSRGWTGVLVEADPEHFARLAETYADCPSVTLLNAAVGNGGEMEFHYVDSTATELPDWARGIGSLLKPTVLKHAAECPTLPQHVRSRVIVTISINSVLERIAAPAIDLLVTDVEGYDAELIRQIDFARRAPRCVYYESRHLERADHDRLLRQLIAHGYQVSPGPIDSVAIRPELVAELTNADRSA